MITEKDDLHARLAEERRQAKVNHLYRLYALIASVTGWAAVIFWALFLRPGLWHLVFAALWVVGWSVSSFCRGRIRS